MTRVFLHPYKARVERSRRVATPLGGCLSEWTALRWTSPGEPVVVGFLDPETGGYADSEPQRPAYCALLGVSTARRVGPDAPTDAIVVPGVRMRFFQVAYRLLARLGRVGVPTNLDPTVHQLGVKVRLEQRLRTFERATGESVLRPRTWILPTHNDGRVRDQIAREARFPVISKPSARSRSLDVQIARDPGQLGPAYQPRVVQELLDRPALIAGHKADLRVYLVLWARSGKVEAASPSFFLVRRAGIPHSAGLVDAEVCSGARHRDVRLIASAPSMQRYIPAAKALLEQVVRMVAQSPPRQPLFAIWGLDLLPIAESDDVMLVEINPYPALHFDVPEVDRAMDGYLAEEVRPLLDRYLAG